MSKTTITALGVAGLVALVALGAQAPSPGDPGILEALRQDVLGLMTRVKVLEKKVRELEGRMPTPADAAVMSPGLRNLVKTLRGDSNRFHRRDAVSALGQLGPEAEAALPALIETLLEDSDRWTRNRAAGRLPAVAAKASSAMRRKVFAALTKATKDADPDVRKTAAAALKAMRQQKK